MFMKFLRTLSTQRLLATIAGLVLAVAGGTAIAVAASGSGPVPAKKPLAQAVHDALAAKSISGISADVTFTNHLIDGASLAGGGTPLLTGATATSPDSGADVETPARTHQALPEMRFGERAQQEDLRVSPTLTLPAKSRRQHPAVVEDQQIAGVQQTR